MAQRDEGSEGYSEPLFVTSEYSEMKAYLKGACDAYNSSMVAWTMNGTTGEIIKFE